MADFDWLSEPEQRMWRSFQRMRRVLDRGLERQLASEAGLSNPDFEVLVSLSEAPERQLRARDLARGLNWDRSRVSHHLRRMEQRGLIERRNCPGDARGTVITLTASGWGLIQDAAPAHVATVRSYVFDVLSPADVATFTELAERISAHATAVMASACASEPSVDACSGPPADESADEAEATT